MKLIERWMVAAVAVAMSGAEPAAWEHRKFTMYYFGLTTLYTCDGLEEHVNQILLYWGARKDMTVRARGCTGGIHDPSRSAWVDADFYSLIPASDSSGPGVVSAEWKSVDLSRQHPSFMQDGDCELVQHLKDSTLKNFSLRNIDYRTSCLPRDVRIGSYSVKAEALKLAPAAIPGAKASAGS